MTEKIVSKAKKLVIGAGIVGASFMGGRMSAKTDGSVEQKPKHKIENVTSPQDTILKARKTFDDTQKQLTPAQRKKANEEFAKDMRNRKNWKKVDSTSVRVMHAPSMDKQR